MRSIRKRGSTGDEAKKNSRRRTRTSKWTDELRNRPDLVTLFKRGVQQATHVNSHPAPSEHDEDVAVPDDEVYENTSRQSPQTPNDVEDSRPSEDPPRNNQENEDERNQSNDVEFEEECPLDEEIWPFHEQQIRSVSNHFDPNDDPRGDIIDIVTDGVQHEDSSNQCFDLPIGEHDDSSEAIYRSGEGARVAARRMIKIFGHWTNLIAIVSVCGSVRYTVQQYKLLRFLLHYILSTTPLPAYRTIQRTIFRYALSRCFPVSELFHYPINKTTLRPSKAFPRSSNTASSARGAQNDGSRREGSLTPVRLVMPSEWAKMDVSMQPLYQKMFPNSMGYGSIECSEMVDHHYKPNRFFFVKDGEFSVPAFPGCTIRLNVSGLDKLRREMSEHYHFRLRDPSSRTFELTSVVAATWCVGSLCHTTESAKKAILNSIGIEKRVVIAYCTAAPLSKETYVAAVGRGTRGRKRIRPSRQPVVPGDICCLLRSKSSEAPTYVCMLVARFWRDMDGVAATRLCWFNVETTKSSSGSRNSDLARPVHIGDQQVFDPISLINETTSIHRTTGSCVFQGAMPRKQDILLDGTKYVVYRMLLYCDDFRPFSSTYPKGSAGGCYMLPLGLPPGNRNTRASVRILGLTPLGVSTNKVLLDIFRTLFEVPLKYLIQ